MILCFLFCHLPFLIVLMTEFNSWMAIWWLKWSMGWQVGWWNKCLWNRAEITERSGYGKGPFASVCLSVCLSAIVCFEFYSSACKVSPYGLWMFIMDGVGQGGVNMGTQIYLHTIWTSWNGNRSWRKGTEWSWPFSRSDSMALLTTSFSCKLMDHLLPV